MRRALLVPLAAMLWVATAVAMLACALLLPSPAPVDRAAQGGADVVRRFYAAVNEAIATGNLSDLNTVVASHFVDEAPLPGVAPGRDGLENYVLALHGAVPELRLVAEVMVASADEVATHVEVRDNQTSTVLPAAVGERPAVWSAVEVLRVADGTVVGRRANSQGLVLARPLAEGTLELPIPAPRVIGLARVTIAPGAQWGAPLGGPRFFFVEEGSLDVQVARGTDPRAPVGAGLDVMASDDGSSGATQHVMLAGGRTWQATAGARIGIMNVGAAAARLLVVTFSEPQIPNGTLPDVERLPSGVEVQILAGEMASRLGTGPVTVVLERIALGPDAGLSLSSAGGPMLIVVETARLEAAAWGTAWVRNRGDGASVASRAATLTAENGLLLQPGGLVTLHNGERHPVPALVVTFRTDSRFS
jgi:predicted ester cyclase